MKDQPSKIHALQKSASIVNGPYKLRLPFETRNRTSLWVTLVIIATLMSVLAPLALAQHALPEHPDGVTVQGIVLDFANKPVGDASVLLERKDTPGNITTKTSTDGVFIFSALRPGTYTLSAVRSGLRSHVSTITLSDGDQKHINLVLGASGIMQSNSSGSTASSTKAMEFADQPNFTVAGITDWTAVGGHGSDFSLRTSEALARDTLTLKPEGLGQDAASLPGGAGEANESENKLRALLADAPGSFEANHQLGEFYFRSGRYRESIPLLQTSYQISPENYGNEYELALAYKEVGEFSQSSEHFRKMLAHQNNADLHRSLGDIDEKLGDPLAAVHEYEQAVRLDPSEQNYFNWGSELLLHRAVWQAQEVFGKGAFAYPKSARMLTGLGTALFASGLYDQAALRLCDATDLNPTDPAPYISLGKIEMASSMPLACVKQKLARFVQEQPGNALANYYYAMALWKRQEPGVNPQAAQLVETLLTNAVTIDPKCGDGYLQLGILHFAQRDVPNAIAFYKKAIEANSQLGEAHYRLGVAYDRMGEPAKAKEEFQLHDQIEEQQAATIERQRRAVKQFLVILQGPQTGPPAH